LEEGQILFPAHTYAYRNQQLWVTVGSMAKIRLMPGVDNVGTCPSGLILLALSKMTTKGIPRERALAY
jgi:hypothetical protein